MKTNAVSFEHKGIPGTVEDGLVSWGGASFQVEAASGDLRYEIERAVQRSKPKRRNPAYAMSICRTGFRFVTGMRDDYLGETCVLESDIGCIDATSMIPCGSVIENRAWAVDMLPRIEIR